MPRDALAAWLQPEAGHALEDHLYLVDPMGEWMMRVPADPEPGARQARPGPAAARLVLVGPAGPLSTHRTMDFAPSLRLLMLASAIALLPLGWVWLRQPQADAPRAGCWR